MGIINAFPEKQKQITVDTSLSTTSTNPVQNKVITGALNNKADKTYVDNAVDSNVIYRIDSTTYGTSGTISIPVQFAVGDIYSLKCVGYSDGSGIEMYTNTFDSGLSRTLYYGGSTSKPVGTETKTGWVEVATFYDANITFCIDINIFVLSETSIRYHSQYGGDHNESIGIGSGRLVTTNLPTTLNLDIGGSSASISSLVLTKVN